MHHSGRSSAPLRSRRPSGRDLAPAAGLLVLGLAEWYWVVGAGRPLPLLVLLPLTIPLAWRRLRPSVTALVVTAALVLQVPWAAIRAFEQTFTAFMCLLLASYALGRHGRTPSAGPVLLGCVLAVGVALGWHDGSVGTFVLGIVFVAAPAAIGRVVGGRSELRGLVELQADQLCANAEAAERTRVAQVRGRIAAEVQELVRHRVHDMVERSEAARRLAPRDSAAAARLMATVEVDGRAALAEIRTMLGVLRTTDPSGPGPLAASTEAPPASRPARQLPVRHVELVLATSVVAALLAETALRPDRLPLVSLTLLGPLVTFVVGARTRGPAAVAGLAVVALAIIAVNVLAGGAGWGDHVFPLVLVAAAWWGGRLVREQNDLVEQSRRRAADLQRGARTRAAAAAGEERLRLARELHDVLAHTLMVMVVQAGAARRSLESGRAGGAQAMRVVAETGRDADTELRQLLSLVDPTAAGAPEVDGPSPGLGDLRSLVGVARSAGLDAGLVVEGEAVPVPAGLALAVYRVAQEAVTNVIRHADDAQHVDVTLRYGAEQLRLEVTDDGRTASEHAGAEAGNGITGMRERAGLHGGEVVAGPSPGRGFVVSASFPLARVLREQPA